MLQSARALSNEEVVESKETGISLPLAAIELIIKTVESIVTNGGHASLEVIATSIGKSEGSARWAISSGQSLGLIMPRGDEYSLSSPLGENFASADETGRKKILSKVILDYEPYHTVLLKLKNAKDCTLSKSDVTKAWWALFKTGKERSRQLYTTSFVSLSNWAGIIKSSKNTIILNEEWKVLLEGNITPNPSSPPPPTPPTPSGKPLKNNAEQKPDGHTNPSINLPLNATVAINISVDAKDPTAIENLLKIIKELRGQNVSSSSA